MTASSPVPAPKDPTTFRAHPRCSRGTPGSVAHTHVAGAVSNSLAS